jgi:2-octaprenyl-6-methoxyphenol hydroxylase
MSHVLVIGAGPVGATFALLAKAHGLDVSLIDARDGPSTEKRTLALSHGSRGLLERAGAWGQGLPATEIHRIHTSQKGGFGRVMLDRSELGVAALGYVVRYAELQAKLDDRLMAEGISVVYGASVTAVQSREGIVKYANNDGEFSTATAVVVMADGGANLDKLEGVTAVVKDYGQSAMLAHVVTDRPHLNVAYERFTPEGPAALLPTIGGSCDFSTVWVAAHEKIDRLMSLSDEDAKEAFQTHFGKRAGQFTKLVNRRRYPLKLKQASLRVVDKVAIIGNAAQAMHPVAGQGFNLGLRDASALATALAATHAPTGVGKFRPSSDVDDVLGKYAAMRETDIKRGVGFTDLLASAFLSDAATLRWPRGFALATVDMLPFARRALAERMLFGAQL